MHVHLAINIHLTIRLEHLHTEYIQLYCGIRIGSIPTLHIKQGNSLPRVLQDWTQIRCLVDEYLITPSVCNRNLGTAYLPRRSSLTSLACFSPSFLSIWSIWLERTSSALKVHPIVAGLVYSNVLFRVDHLLMKLELARSFWWRHMGV